MRIEVGGDTLHRSLAGETVLINLATGLCFRLDETAARIWELIVEHGNRARIEESLVSEFEAPRDRIRTDLDAFLGELLEKELVTVAQDSAG